MMQLQAVCRAKRVFSSAGLPPALRLLLAGAATSDMAATVAVHTVSYSL